MSTPRLADEASSSDGSAESPSNVDNVACQPFAIAVLLFAIAVVATASFRTRGALIAACALALVGFAAIGALEAVVGGKRSDLVAEATKKANGQRGDAANCMAKDVMNDIDEVVALVYG